ncbi:hypothetical protein IFR04_004566 [Cadophora malorum]|uniref:BTB domain-containing protein n=1 Tax=Cadophora malorum TaxID=108018 RepID=A0A8H8BRU3_9HELO|nr:hypothetical protein IFR04_004566 [Cadophora malorum]
MPASFEELLSSRIFKFTVGAKVDGQETTFSVHEEAIAAHSQPLHALMRSGLSESEAGHATWEDLSKDTFVRFAQFAYTGDYSVPVSVMPLVEASEPPPAPDHEPEDELRGFNNTTYVVVGGQVMVDYGWGRYGTVTEKKLSKKELKKKLSQVTDVEQGWFQAPFPLIAPRNNYEGTCEPNSTFEPWVDYSVLFISHTSLWILDDCRHIESLKALALYKLHKTLCAFQLNIDNVHAVIELVKCAYSEEGAGLGEGISGLRKLVCQYLGPKKALLCTDDGFMDLLGEGGQFVKDFFKYSSA